MGVSLPCSMSQDSLGVRPIHLSARTNMSVILGKTAARIAARAVGKVERRFIAKHSLRSATCCTEKRGAVRA